MENDDETQEILRGIQSSLAGVRADLSGVRADLAGTNLRLERLAAPGFRVAEFTALEPEAARHALHRGEKIFIGRKPLAVPGTGPDTGEV